MALDPDRLERVMGIEPTLPAWKAGALPLSYTRISGSNIAPGRCRSRIAPGAPQVSSLLRESPPPGLPTVPSGQVFAFTGNADMI